MNKPQTYSPADPKSSSTNLASRYVLGALAALASLPAVTSIAHADDAPPSKSHALVNFEFSDKYLTPRGMIVQNEGLVFQNLVLGFFSLGGCENFNATLVGGVWNCFGTDSLPASGGGNTQWYEIDPIAGISLGLGKYATLDVTYTAFNMQILAFPGGPALGTSEHLETKLSFKDGDLLGKFALSPYIILWTELENKAVANTDGARADESFYFDIGIAPSYSFGDSGVKLEAPCRVLLAESDFYGTGAGGHSTVGLYELGLKASTPLKFMPAGYGNWSAHLGFKYMAFKDDNLRATQGRSETCQIFGGLTTFF